jgi:predicted nucleic acid-binding protein
MTGVVVDASVALAWCFPDEGSNEADRMLASLKSLAIWVPAVWALEIANAMLVGERRKRLKQPDIMRFIALLESLPITQDRQTVSENVRNLLPLGQVHGLSAYDAAYLDLAIRRNAPLATLDTDLQKAATRAGIAVF